MASDYRMRVLFALSLLVMLVSAPSCAMVIPDADSGELAIGTDFDGEATSTADTTPEPPSEPPPPSGTQLLENVGWVCGLIKPVSHIPLNKIMGRWYLLEVFSPTSQKRQDACAGVDFWRWDDEENNLMPEVAPPPIVGADHLVMRGFNKHVNDHHQSSFRIDTALIVQGSGGAIWHQPGERTVRSVSACTVAVGATVAVLDFTPDAQFMTVTTCVRAIGIEWTSVLGRDPNATAVLPREELHERLRAAGLSYVDSARLQENSECTYP